MSLPTDAEITALAGRMPTKDRSTTRQLSTMTTPDGRSMKVVAEYLDVIIAGEIGDLGFMSVSPWYQVAGDFTKLEGITPVRLAAIRAAAAKATSRVQKG